MKTTNSTQTTMTQTKTYPIIMIPTKEHTNLFIANGKLYNGNLSDTTISHYICQHLYILSDEEIKEGNYFINFDGVWQYNLVKPNGNAKKIIASTDPSLINITRETYLNRSIKVEELPQIPQSYLPIYAKAYNEGKQINEVELEVESDKIVYGGGLLPGNEIGVKGNQAYESYKIKTNPNNEVIIVDNKNDIKIIISEEELREKYIELHTKNWDEETKQEYMPFLEKDFKTWYEGYLYANQFKQEKLYTRAAMKICDSYNESTINQFTTTGTQCEVVRNSDDITTATSCKECGQFTCRCKSEKTSISIGYLSPGTTPSKAVEKIGTYCDKCCQYICICKVGVGENRAIIDPLTRKIGCNELLTPILPDNPKNWK